jgi:ATP-dependent RNA helicase DDX49/DBP8
MIVKAKNQAVNKNIYNVVGLKTMKSLGLIKPLVQLCETLHITTPTIIQQKCIPRILQGENLVGIAETGTGKTACYCLPTLQLLTKECYGIFGLILLPTKELAFQVFEQFRVFSTLFGWESEIAWIVGGDKWLMQSQTLARRPFIVVATPGRLLQHLENTDVRASFKNLRILVFDEADSLLDNTLQSEVQQVIFVFDLFINNLIYVCCM